MIYHFCVLSLMICVLPAMKIEQLFKNKGNTIVKEPKKAKYDRKSLFTKKQYITEKASTFSVEVKSTVDKNFPNVMILHAVIRADHSKSASQENKKSNDNNVIVLVDVSQKGFDNVHLCFSECSSAAPSANKNKEWWLNYKVYAASVKEMLDMYCEQQTVIIQSIMDCIFDKEPQRLSFNEDVVDVFTDNFHYCDSLITLYKPQNTKDKVSFPLQYVFFNFILDSSAKAFLASLGVMASKSDKREATTVQGHATNAHAAEDYQLRYYHVNESKRLLYRWHSLPICGTESHWISSSPHLDLRVCELARYLLMFAQGSKYGVADVCWLPDGTLYWLQHLSVEHVCCHPRLFALLRCNVFEGLKSEVLKVMISAEQTNRFRLIRLTNWLIIWSFHASGAFGDVFAIHPLSSTHKIIADDHHIDNNHPLSNRLFKILNSLQLKDYQFNNTKIVELYRDLAKIATLRQEIMIFCGGCIVSTLAGEALEHLQLNDENLEKIDNRLQAYGHLVVVPTTALQITGDGYTNKDKGWIIDFVPIHDHSILARWNDATGGMHFGIWKQQTNNKWTLERVVNWVEQLKEWNQCIQSCFFWAERVKTHLIAILTIQHN
ncbi:hypothetical protein RFI_16805 [Reticulomyxa filosa]|uniref:Uncharacterized protein n=1 Tax=Reticulomyxa filosa TaxID=46433 RepID=X6N2D7_RETFI|nr:hypothetical protein RFI_16805 [Reticulomyxa filosa]|eukprot:ETO20415.1 hypothetical protein RFI_16805 [Reticulomyxa filosa]